MKDILFIERGRDELNDVFFQPLVEGQGDKRLNRLSVKRATCSFFLRQRDYRAGIYDCLTVNMDEFATIEKVSRLTEGLPILVTARHIDLDAYQALQQLKNVTTLQRFFNVDVFRNMLTRMSAGEAFRPRACRRFRAHEQVRLLFTNSGATTQGRIVNYSAGGMFVEWRGMDANPGEHVRIIMPDTPKDTSLALTAPLNARIVWRVPRGAGLQFI